MRRLELCAIWPVRAGRGDGEGIEAAVAAGQPPAALGQLHLQRLRGAGGDVVALAAELEGDLQPCEPDGLGRAHCERARGVAGRRRRSAHLDRRYAPPHLDRAAADGHRLRAVRDRRRRGVRRAVDDLEAVEDVELPDIGNDRVVAGAAAGQVGRPVADVDLVVALVSGDDVDAAARGDRVVARPAEERLRRAAACQRVVARAA